MRAAARLARTARPSAPPIMNEVLTTPEARPDSLGATSLMAASSTGLKAMPRADSEQDHAGRTSTTKFPSTGARAKSTSPIAASSSPIASGVLDAETHDKPGGEAERESGHDQIGRQEGETDLHRAVPEHQLEVERREEEPGEHGGGPQDADDVGGRDVAQPEEAERHERRAHPSFDAEEDRQQRQRRSKQADRLAGSPPDLVAVHDRIDREHQRHRHRDRAGDVETSPWPGRGQPAAGRRRGQRPRHRSGG